MNWVIMSLCNQQASKGKEELVQDRRAPQAGLHPNVPDRATTRASERGSASTGPLTGIPVDMVSRTRIAVVAVWRRRRIGWSRTVGGGRGERRGWR